MMRYDLALGIAGVLLLVANGRLWWGVMTSPGDDNPVAMFFVLGVLLALLPAAALPRALVWRRPAGWVFRSAATLAAAVAALPVLVFWRALFS